MLTMIEKNCKSCKSPMEVRLADHNRGWGKFCSKSCKAQYQTKVTGIAGPHYAAVGRTVKEMKNGKFSKSTLGKNGAPKNGIFRYGERVMCATCGVPATNGVESIIANTPIDPIHGYRIEWSCDMHFDDSHPFDSDAAGFNNE
jgi:endogenous inhibitor of DNA gyrase (YacG/DUF329 family)